MNEHSLAVLEFGRFLEFLSRYACSESGRLRIRELRPCLSPDDVALDRQLYAEALALRRTDARMPAARFDSPATVLTHAAPEGAVVEAGDFRIVRRLLEAADAVRSFLLGGLASDAPGLRGLADGLDPCRDLARQIDRTFEGQEGRVRSDASERLRQLRERILSFERNIQDQLERMLRNPSLLELFQDTFVTTRSGRFVLPVRRELRDKLPGIVHDQSNTGQTLFVEPQDTVEAGNELECLRLDERDEVRRILLALTAELRRHIPAVREDFELLSWYDAIYAVSAWGREFDCLIPADGPVLRLVQARHPLLQHQLKSEQRLSDLVPLDVHIPEGKNVVVITGSNTGGKTVALKTIGLIAALAQSGLPVPAGAGTEVRFYADVLADIGDEQSIEQSLSTFSAHLGHIVKTLAAARAAESLVLLDELGAGTDPVEGGALGCAIIDALSRARGVTFATTHLGAVKRFVHAHPRMENASMLFDAATLRPRYRLQMGQAGASYALTIAERCGVPADVLETARSLMSEGDRNLELLLASLDEKRIRLDRQMDDLARAQGETDAAREEARRDHAQADQALQDLQKARKQMLHQAHSEAASLVTNARREMERLLTQAKQKPDRDQARELRGRVEQRAQSLAQGARQTEERPDRPFAPGELKVGDPVWVEFMKTAGTVAAIGGGGERVTVSTGNMRVDVGLGYLSRPRGGGGAAGGATPARAVERPPRPKAASELVLVGQRVDEAMARLERFMDTAMLGGRGELRIVHGYGTGALRQAVHDYLAKAGVKSFRLGETDRDPGGPGVTIVTL